MVFWGFEVYGVVRIWKLQCSEDLSIKVLWGFEEYGVLRIWGLWYFEDLSTMLYEDLSLMVSWGYEDYGVLTIMVFWRFKNYDVLRIMVEDGGFWFSEDLRIMVYYDLTTMIFEVMRIFWRFWSDNLRIMVFWEFENYGILRI